MHTSCISISRSVMLLAAGIVFPAAALAQSTPAWADQLKAQYKIVKLSADMNGVAVVQPGTVLAIQKTGILGVPFANLVICPARYQSGELHAPTGICPAMAKAISRYFQAGEQIYPMKIDVNVKKEQIGFTFVACDSCNNTDPPTYFKSQVIFEFAKGFLEAATFAQVQSEFSQVFAIPDNNANANQAPPAAPVQNTAPAQTSAPAAAAAPAPDPVPAPIAPPPPPADQPPATVELGQSTDQVVASLGQPQKIAKAGAKTIYFYKDLKVTFTDGKVSDVQ